MKRRIVRLLLVWLLACTLLLAACAPAATTSDVPSEGESGSGETSSTGEIRHTPVSVGKTYTVSEEADKAYPDLFGQQLTDGQKTGDVGVSYTDLRMVGYTANARFDIDLGEDGKRLSGVAVRSLDIDRDGVKLASSFRVYGSNDGKTDWEVLGRTNFVGTGNQTVSTAAIYFDELYDYRYIRISIVKEGAFYFVDELEVYADVEEKEEPSDGVASMYATEALNRAEWKALSTGTAVSHAYSANVALNSTYTFTGTFDSRAPQNDTYLTDGARTGRLFGDDVWVGLQADSSPSVTLDLGEVRNDVYAVRLYMLGSGLYVELPAAVDVYGSADGKEYTLLGRIYAPASCDHHAYTLILSEYIGVRYLRFAFASGSENYWMEEIEVMAGLEEALAEELYPALNFPYVAEDVYWDPTDEDYTRTQNLLLGLTQQVACSGYSLPTHLNTSGVYESEWDSPVLTDGKLAQNMYCYGGEWFYSSGGNALDIIYDIGALSTVESLHINLLEQTEWGITRPKYMSVFLSDDGENWYKVYDYSREEEGASFYSGATHVPFDCEPETPYAARFVRFRFESGMLFIDELEAIGTKEVKAGTARLADSGIQPVVYYTNPDREQYANSENTTVKASDIVCVYGNYGDADMLKAYVAYLDEDGKAVDTFMDGFLYGMTGSLPSGGPAHLYNNQSDWESNFDTIFNGCAGLDQLEQAVGEVKQELNRPDYQVYVYITMWTVLEQVTDFGDVDGDGVSENLSVAADRKKVVNWFTDLCIREFNARGYENIVLDGFYWQSESVNWEADNSAIIAEVSDYIHEANTNFLWIPYYEANRYHLGYELGFDLVCMQPNYMFDLEKPLYRFTVTASRTKRQGMCVEIEHWGDALTDPLYVRNYMLYLYYGAVTGYMDGATHIYYQDLDNFAQLAYSDDPMHRMQYDATYAFVKGTLEVTPETRDTVNLTAKKDTMLEGSLNTDGSISMYTLVSATENGYVTLASDGSYRYFPNQGFTGTDSFTYTYNHYLGESEVCTVEITVE